jgi:hypothetical protein
VRGLLPALNQTPRGGGRGERRVILRSPTWGFQRPRLAESSGPDWDMSDFHHGKPVRDLFFIQMKSCRENAWFADWRAGRAGNFPFSPR